MEFKKRLFINIGIPFGICLILAGALFFLGSDIVKLANRIEQSQKDLNLRVAMAESLALLRQDSEKAKHYLVELESLLPSRDQLISFSSDLNMIARQNQVSVNSSLGQEVLGSANEPGRIGFTVVSQSSFDNFLGFLKTLKNSRYFVKIETLDFGRQDGAFKALMTGQVFSF
jgi:hypothetical protein